MAILEESCGSKLVHQTTTHTTLLITSCNVLTNLKTSAIITHFPLYIIESSSSDLEAFVRERIMVSLLLQ